MVFSYFCNMKAYIIIGMAALLCSCQKSWEERCAEEAQRITETTCPRQMPYDIIMDSMTYDAQLNRFNYYYRVAGERDKPEIFIAGKEEMLELLKQQYDNSIELKKYKEHGMSFRCIYYSGSTGQNYLDYVWENNKK